jgi:histidinol-phosphate/aromatic aminotransferase/cobyric acid decarboxylase-like protein
VSGIPRIAPEPADAIRCKFDRLKQGSGTHSPSIATIRRDIPELRIEVDACFLSNPYATDLFMERLDRDLIATGRLRDVLEFYPPQNYDAAGYISQVSGIPPDFIFPGNGASEVIQAVIQRFAGPIVALPVPTFSPFYEFAPAATQVRFYRLDEAAGFRLDVADYCRFVRECGATTAILVNPNNPNGYYVARDEVRALLSSLRDLSAVLLDESFIHFAYEDDDSLDMVSSERLVEEFSNLIVVKSMSKDFGIAGVRAGYGIMQPARVQELTASGYLWNLSGLADYFFRTYGEPGFRTQYEEARRRFIRDSDSFFAEARAIEGITVYPTRANFMLVCLADGWRSFDFAMEMLINHGVYTRDCSDKVGLEGPFIRIASRSRTENVRILHALRQTAVTGP